MNRELLKRPFIYTIACDIVSDLKKIRENEIIKKVVSICSNSFSVGSILLWPTVVRYFLFVPSMTDGKIKAVISGSGHVYYTGNPEIEKTVIGSGGVIER